MKKMISLVVVASMFSLALGVMGAEEKDVTEPKPVKRCFKDEDGDGRCDKSKAEEGKCGTNCNKGFEDLKGKALKKCFKDANNDRVCDSSVDGGGKCKANCKRKPLKGEEVKPAAAGEGNACNGPSSNCAQCGMCLCAFCGLCATKG